MGGRGDAEETVKGGGDLELVVGAGEVGFGGVAVVMVSGVGSKVRHVVHGKGRESVEASIDALAVEDEAQHTVGLADQEVLVDDALAERGRRCFEDAGCKNPSKRRV
jgi:hypothetical protein